MSDEALLDDFLGYVDGLGLELYPAQEEAILELFDGRSVVLETPTGSGKSLVAAALHHRALHRGERSVYTSPNKALVSEKFFALCEAFGAENVGMLTGDGAVNPDAPILCCTAEVLANQALRDGAGADVDAVVMDEFHYYGDRDRGTAWQIPLLVLEDVQYLLMSATLGDVTRIVERLDAAHVTSSDRPVPLSFEYADDTLLETLADLVRRDRAPVYLVHFSQREATAQGEALVSADLVGKERRRAIRDELKGFRFDTPFGPKLRRCLEHGVGIHHAGLLPKYRRLVERLAQTGVLAVISGTDTLGVGVNVPIRTVLLSRLYKFDGQKSAVLTVRAFHQIAGRAGRRGFDDHGYVVAQAPAHVVENRRREAKVQMGQMAKKKFRREQPPKGYVAYDETTFERLCSGRPEALKPVFRIDHGTLVNVLRRHPDDVYAGMDELSDLIDRAHVGPTDKVKLKERAEQLLTSLAEAGIVVEETGRLAADLPPNFSVFGSLPLFVLFALTDLDPEAADYPARVISLVEAISESPRPILGAQRRRERGEAVAMMKAEGMDYAERMEALESVDHPKPDADWLYDRFDEYLVRRPWLAAEHVRPKGIAREMYEGYLGFSEYVRELKIAPLEGVLLRYLSQVYKVLARTLPPSALTDDLVDAIAWLRAVVAQADSSLLAEWEELVSGAGDAPVTPSGPPPAVVLDPRTLRSRVRAAVHLLVRALAAQAWDDAAACLRSGDVAAIQDALEAPVRFDHAARLSEHTTLRDAGDGVWEVGQALLGEDDEVVATLALEADFAAEPLLELVDVHR